MVYNNFYATKRLHLKYMNEIAAPGGKAGSAVAIWLEIISKHFASGAVRNINWLL